MTQKKSKTRTPAKAEPSSSRRSGLAFAFTRFSNAVARATGRPVTFVMCCLIILAWAVTGPLFHFSDTWQLIINTGTTIVTFLMVFLIQNTQNRDGAAIQAKLDEIIRSIEGARNRFIGIEHLTEDELEEIRKTCEDEVKAIAEEEERVRHKHRLRHTFERLSRGG